MHARVDEYSEAVADLSPFLLLDQRPFSLRKLCILELVRPEGLPLQVQLRDTYTGFVKRLGCDLKEYLREVLPPDIATDLIQEAARAGTLVPELFEAVMTPDIRHLNLRCSLWDLNKDITVLWHAAPPRDKISPTFHGVEELDLTRAQLSGSPSLEAVLHALSLGIMRIPYDREDNWFGAKFSRTSAVQTRGVLFSRLHTLRLSQSQLIDSKEFRHLCMSLCGSPLTCLDVSHCTFITDEGLLAVSSYLPQLRALDASGFTCVTQAGLESLGTLRHLQELALKGCHCSSAGWLGAQGTWPDLTALDLTGLGKGVTQDELAVILTPDTCSRMKKLRVGELDISRFGLQGGIFAPAVDGAVHMLPLTDLDLSWCESLDVEALSGVLERCRGLMQVSLQCLPLTGACMSALAHSCSSLTALNLNRCRFNTGTLTSFINARSSRAYGSIDSHVKCPNLVFLDLAWCEASEGCIRSLLARCPRLVHLCLEGCKEVTIECFSDPLNVVALRYLSLAWCDAISSDAAKSLSISRPRVLVVDYYGDCHRDGKVLGDLADSDVRQRVLADVG